MAITQSGDHVDSPLTPPGFECMKTLSLFIPAICVIRSADPSPTHLRRPLVREGGESSARQSSAVWQRPVPGSHTFFFSRAADFLEGT